MDRYGLHMETLGCHWEPSLEIQKTAEKSSSSLWNSAFSHIVLKIDTKGSFLTAFGGFCHPWAAPWSSTVTPSKSQCSPMGSGKDCWPVPTVLGAGERTATHSSHTAFHQNLLFSSFWQIKPTLFSNYFVRIFLWTLSCY